MASAVPRHRFTDLNLVPLAVPVGSYAVQMLRWGFIRPIPWRNYWHRHSFVEVCYAFQGRGVFRVGATETPVQAGDVLIAKPGETHEIVSDAQDGLGLYHWSYTLVSPGARRPRPES